MNVRRRWYLILGLFLVVGSLLAFLLGPLLFASVLYPLPDKYRPSIAKWVPEYCSAVPDAHHLLPALIYTESTWKETARSSVGAVGMTQFMPATATAVAKRLGVSPFTPSDLSKDSDLSIRFGAYYLCTRIGDYRGDVGKALIAYNGGGGAVMAFERGYPVKGTVAYRDKILAISRVYKSSYGEWWKAPNLGIGGSPTPTSEPTSSGTASFNVTPKTSFLGTPILDFWKGLLSDPVKNNTGAVETSGTNQDSSLNSFWQNLLPGN